MDEMKKLLEKHGFKVHEDGKSLRVKGTPGLNAEMEFYFSDVGLEIFMSPSPYGAWIRPAHHK